jgi:FixJ family two-component response regulator
MSHNTPVVYVVDEDASSRKFIEDVILGAGLCVQCFESAAEFLAQPRACLPSCLILDVNLKNPDCGLELQARVTGEHNDMPIIFFTCCRDIATSVRAMKAGAFE